MQGVSGFVGICAVLQIIGWGVATRTSGIVGSFSGQPSLGRVGFDSLGISFWQCCC